MCIITQWAVSSSQVPLVMLDLHTRSHGAIGDFCMDRHFLSIFPNIVAHARTRGKTIVGTNTAGSATTSTLNQGCSCVQNCDSTNSLLHPTNAVLNLDIQGRFHWRQLWIWEDPKDATCQGQCLSTQVLGGSIKKVCQGCGRCHSELTIKIQLHNTVTINKTHAQKSIEDESGTRRACYTANHIESEWFHNSRLQMHLSNLRLQWREFLS